jgi:hypothetical protein
MTTRQAIARPITAAQNDDELSGGLSAFEANEAAGDDGGRKDSEDDEDASRARTRRDLLVIEALRHAHRDLLFHAEERNTYMRYFLVIIGALATGFGHAYLSKEYLFALAAASLSTFISLIFLILDTRHVARIHIASTAVSELQTVVANELGMKAMQLVKQSRSFLSDLMRWLRMTPLQSLFWIGFIVSLASLGMDVEKFGHLRCGDAIKKPVERVDALVCLYAVPMAGTLDAVLPSPKAASPRTKAAGAARLSVKAAGAR